MKTNLFKLMLMLAIPAIMVSCEESEDATPPEQITGAEATAQDQSVLIQWTDPADGDLEKVIISYTNEIEYNVEVEAGIQEKTIKGLTNNQEYTFTLKAVDKSGNESLEVTLTATPELAIPTINGYEIENGTYQVKDKYGYTTTDVFSGTNTLNVSLQAGANTFSWTGTWERVGVSVVNHLVNDASQDAFSDTLSAAFCFRLQGMQYYYQGAYEKVSGEPDELVGEYEYSINKDEAVIKRLEILSDGSYELFNDNTFDRYGAWSEDDIRDMKFVFIQFMDKQFLYFPDSRVMTKQ